MTEGMHAGAVVRGAASRGNSAGDSLEEGRLSLDFGCLFLLQSNAPPT